MALGWISLTLAAGTGYYFAKKDIDARRKEQLLRHSITQDKHDWEKKVYLDKKKDENNQKCQKETICDQNLINNNSNNSSEKCHISNQSCIKSEQKEDKL
ncbi:hypothetical protein PCANB_002991 [Pneumocystis canis]|nr:hypothetical protein PCANB_002991 [Pneumocystis canis]